MTVLFPREAELFAAMAERLRHIADEIRANPRSGCQIDRRLDSYAAAIEADLALVSWPHTGSKRA